MQNKKNQNNKTKSDGQKMVSAALASWQLVISDTRTDECCSPLPPNKNPNKYNPNQNNKTHEQKFVSDLLQKSSIAFKAHKDELDANKENRDKPIFSARRSLDKLLALSGLKKEANGVNNSFLIRSTNTPPNNKKIKRDIKYFNNVTMVPPSRSTSIDSEKKENNNNPYLDNNLIQAQQQYNPIKNKQFET
eukprot:UN07658